MVGEPSLAELLLRIGAGQIGARDQRIGGERAALVGPQRLAAPLRRLTVRPSRRARGNVIGVRPNVPVSARVRLPWR